MSKEEKCEVEVKKATPEAEALSELKEELTEQEKELKTTLDNEAKTLQPKLEAVCNEIVSVFNKHGVTPFQSLMVMRMLSDGIINMMEEQTIGKAVATPTASAA